MAPARASSSAWTSPRSRRRTRRRSAASSAATASPRGATPARSARPTRWRSSARRERFLAEHGSAEPFGAVVPGYEPLPEAERRAKAAALAPVDPRPGLARTRRRSGTSPTPTSCWTSWRGRSSRRWPSSARRCPDHFLRTKVKPLVLDLPGDRAGRGDRRAADGAARGLPRRTTRPTTTGTPPRTRPPMRGADPAIVLVPGVGHVLLRQGQADRPGRRRVLRQRDQRDARRRGGLDVRADRRERRSSGSSTGRWRRPSSQRMPKPKPLATRVALVTGAGVGHRQGHRRAARRRGRLRRRRRPRRRRRRRRPPPRSAAPDVAVGVAADVSDEDAVARRCPTRPCSPSAASTWSSTTPGCRSPSRCWRPPSRTGTCSTT